MFEVIEPVAIMFFLVQFKKGRGSNNVPEGEAMWLLATFMAKPPAELPTVWMMPRKNIGNYLYKRRKVEGQVRNS